MSKTLRGALVCLLLLSFVAGCAPAVPVAAPQQVEVTRVVEKEVPVEVTRVVEKIVEVEKEAPAEPAAAPAPESVTLEVLSPAGQASADVIPFAPRVDSLEGKTVALHWNGKPGGEFLLHEIKDRLSAQVKDIKFVDWPKGTAWAEDVARNIKEMPADVAILSVGD